MEKKQLPPSLDEALAKVDPERRRLLGMLLAGAAALPLITTTSLAQDKTKDKSVIKHGPLDDKASSTQIKSDSNIKADSQIKSNSNIKSSPQTIKLTNADKSSSIKSDTVVWKDSNATIKGSNTAIKSDYVKGGSSIKASSSTVKSSTAPKQNTKPN
jgi:hypothetical protein